MVSELDGHKIPSEIKEATGLNLTNVSRVLAVLVQKGLAKCLTPNARVGRVYILTERGKAVRQKLLLGKNKK